MIVYKYTKIGNARRSKALSRQTKTLINKTPSVIIKNISKVG